MPRRGGVRAPDARQRDRADGAAALWVIVDDGSTDGTPAILAEYAARCPTSASSGAPTAASAAWGRASSKRSTPAGHDPTCDDFDYLCKLDLDLDLPPRYFEILMSAWRASRASAPAPASRTSSNRRTRRADAELRRRDVGGHDQVLPARLLRADRRLRAPGHVGRHRLPPLPHARLDRESDDPEPCASSTCARMGSSHKGIWTGRMRHGFGQYFMGTSPLYWFSSQHTAYQLIRCCSAAWPCCGAISGAGSGACHATTTSSSGAFSAPISAPACAWANMPPRRKSTLNGLTFGTPVVRPQGAIEGILPLHAFRLPLFAQLQLCRLLNRPLPQR